MLIWDVVLDPTVLACGKFDAARLRVFRRYLLNYCRVHRSDSAFRGEKIESLYNSMDQSVQKLLIELLKEIRRWGVSCPEADCLSQQKIDLEELVTKLQFATRVAVRSADHTDPNIPDVGLDRDTSDQSKLQIRPLLEFFNEIENDDLMNERNKDVFKGTSSEDLWKNNFQQLVKFVEKVSVVDPYLGSSNEIPREGFHNFLVQLSKDRQSPKPLRLEVITGVVGARSHESYVGPDAAASKIEAVIKEVSWSQGIEYEIHVHRMKNAITKDHHSSVYLFDRFEATFDQRSNLFAGKSVKKRSNFRLRSLAGANGIDRSVLTLIDQIKRTPNTYLKRKGKIQ
jgi:hypothetical protein